MTAEHFDVLVVADGKGGKTLAMDPAKAGGGDGRASAGAHPTMADGLDQPFASWVE